MHVLENKYEKLAEERLIKLLTEKSTRKTISLLQDRSKSVSEIIQNIRKIQHVTETNTVHTIPEQERCHQNT